MAISRRKKRSIFISAVRSAKGRFDRLGFDRLLACWGWRCGLGGVGFSGKEIVVRGDINRFSGEVELARSGVRLTQVELRLELDFVPGAIGRREREEALAQIENLLSQRTIELQADVEWCLRKTLLRILDDPVRHAEIALERRVSARIIARGAVSIQTDGNQFFVAQEGARNGRSAFWFNSTALNVNCAALLVRLIFPATSTLPPLSNPCRMEKLAR